MIYDDKQFIDFGNDENRDEHCDLEGWFVNKIGLHRPRFSDTDFAKNRGLCLPEKMKELIDNIVPAKRQLTKEETRALLDFTQNDKSQFSSKTINRCLRNGNQMSFSQINRVHLIDKCTKSFRLLTDTVLYRGISLDLSTDWGLKMLSLKKGDFYQDPAFTSTTFSMAHATTFATMKGDDVSVIFKILADEGTRCIPIKEEYASHKNEYEVLLGRNTRLEIVKKMADFIDDRYYVYYEARLKQWTFN